MPLKSFFHIYAKPVQERKGAYTNEDKLSSCLPPSGWGWGVLGFLERRELRGAENASHSSTR